MASTQQLPAHAIEACRAIWNSGMAPADKLTAIGHNLGFAPWTGSTAATTAATRRRTAAAAKPAARTPATRNRGTATDATLIERVYNAIPEAGGKQAAAIRLPGVATMAISKALGRLKRDGRLTLVNGVWFRATGQQQGEETAELKRAVG